MSDQEVNASMASDLDVGVASESKTPGAQLAAVRQSHGWSVEQVASQLNLAPRQIHAIESDDYAALPGMPIARGFIRAYAKLLKVDAVPLLATISGDAAVANEGITPPRTLSMPFAETRLPTMVSRQGFSGKRLTGVLAVVALVAGLGMAQQSGKLGEMLQSLTSALGHSDALESVSALASATAPAQAEVTVPVSVESLSTATSTGGEAANVAPVVAMAESPVEVATTADTVAPTIEKTAMEHEALVLKAHADSWIEIKRPDNSIVFSGLVKAGKTETIDLPGPVSLVIGNASGVDASLRGTSLELKANTSSNVARLNLK
ncbi:helix-turn-helix domain-containing protein [Noviherbaspirillum cavernae]|nr:RodZ domain-containing protein [Noviherbaspirillum cavernae]